MKDWKKNTVITEFYTQQKSFKNGSAIRKSGTKTISS